MFTILFFFSTLHLCSTLSPCFLFNPIQVKSVLLLFHSTPIQLNTSNLFLCPVLPRCHLPNFLVCLCSSTVVFQRSLQNCHVFFSHTNNNFWIPIHSLSLLKFCIPLQKRFGSTMPLYLSHSMDSRIHF